MSHDIEERHILHQLLRNHDPVALERLYEYAWLLELVLTQQFGTYIDEEDRKDLVGDTLLHAWETGERYNPELSSVKWWLVVHVTYRARDFLSRDGGANKLHLDALPPVMLVAEHRPSIEQSEMSARLLFLLQQLPARRRRIFEMYYCEERPVSEIAQTMNIAPATVRAHLCNGRASLRELLVADEQDRGG